MLKVLDHDALALVGYTTPWIARPGTQLTVHASTNRAVEKVRVVRLDTPDVREIDWPVAPTGEPARGNAVSIGSWLRIAGEEIARLGPLSSIMLEVLLTRNPTNRRLLDLGRVVLNVSDHVLTLCADGEVLTACEVPSNVWITLRLEFAARDVVMSLDLHEPTGTRHVEHRVPVSTQVGFKTIVIGSDAAERLPTLNARYGRISLTTKSGLAGWRFPQTLTLGPLASEIGIEGVPLEIMNLPTFCVRSRRWDGSSFDPRYVPDQYDAIHCHDDDMHRFDWPAIARIAIPSDAASGIYACEMIFEGGCEQIVFFVSAPCPRSPFLFVVPTATYLAYANEALPEHLYPWLADDRSHRFAQENDLRSLYDFHNDLSGVSITSNLKPMPTLRDDYIYPLSGCPHNLPVDLRLLRFLHRTGIPFDLVTDHDLHARGEDLLAGYRCVLTGSHPEYASREMDQSLRAFMAAGGSLAYLGGNGFSGTVAFRGDLMELRRSPLEAARTWDGPLSEQHFALTNTPGGYLRDIGRGEFTLIGGAMSLMGFEKGRPFCRTPESYSEKVSWLFDGVECDCFGDHGAVLGAAASYEVDAIDLRMGSSPDLIVVARADGFSDGFYHDASRWYPRGEPERAGRRCAEMTLRFLPSGGMIFSASSVGWCGALPVGSEMNDVGRITLNLLDKIRQLPAK